MKPRVRELRDSLRPVQRQAEVGNTMSLMPDSPAPHSPVPSSGGQELDAAVRNDMEERFSFDFSNVRIHANSQAHQSAQSLSAHAYTLGSDIVFNQGQYQPSTASGQRLLAHELAHVVQQQGSPQVQTSLEVSTPGDASELEAERAADAVMNHQAPMLTPVARASVQRFSQGDGTEGHSGHAYMTEQALQGMGLDKDEARQGRFGNWERDLSQALNPGVRAILMEGPAWHGLNIVAIKDFGRGINLEEFGTYDPVEHMDNPTGLRAGDVFQQGGFSADRNAVNHNPDQYLNATPAGGDDQGYAMVDSRYESTPTGTTVIDDAVAAFRVDETGIPTYMNTSKEWLKRTLRGSATLGRQGDGGRGPREFSSGIHTMQDYYAHSNFCEIAINRLIQTGGLEVMDDQHQMQTLAANQSLDTFVHGNDANGNPVADNLSIAGAGGDRREVMTTGSFNLTDTAASILGEVKDTLVEANPFKSKEKGPSALVQAALDYIDMTDPTSFNRTGETLSNLVRPVTSTIAAMGNFGANVVSDAGGVAGGMAGAPMQVGGGILRGMSAVNGWLGGDNDYFDDSARDVEGVGNAVSGSISGVADAGAEQLREVTGLLDAYAVQLQSREHILSEVYAWVSGIDLLQPIKTAARAIPVIGERVATAIEELQTEIHETIESVLGDAYDWAVTQSLSAIDHVIELLRGATNVEQQKIAGAGTSFMDLVARKLGGVGDLYQDGQPQAGIAPQAYSPPSHTEIAKDHSDRTQHDHGDDHEAHEHMSSWLNPIAEALATQATRAIGQKVADGWNIVDSGGNLTESTLNAIDTEVDVWFQHPNDCQPIWDSLIRAQIGDVRVGAQLLEQLSRRHPTSPQTGP